MRCSLAVLSFGAGAVHLVMVPQHAQISGGMGLAFAFAGWFQIAFGAVMLTAPRRLLLWLAIAANLLFVAVWVISRTAGLPDWTGDSGTETAQSADILCVVFEVAVVIGAVALLAAPRFLANWRLPSFAIAALVSLAVVLASTAVFAAPGTATHAHGPDVAHAALASAAHDHAVAGSVAAEGHAHTDSTITYEQLPKATKREVDQVIALWANRYPTAGDAASAGWFKGTRNLYGIGAHYIKSAAFTGAATFDLLNPNILLYDGDGPDAKFAGVSWVVAEKPEGFTGGYDSWHSHTSVCMQGGGITSLSEENSQVWLSESECTTRGGRVFPLSNDQMMHLWIGPGYIDSGPIFAHDHWKLYDGFSPKRDA